MVNGRRITFVGHDLLFPHNVGININSKLYWGGSSKFEPLASGVLVQLFKISDFFFDIGSNFGLYSVLAQKVNQDIRVYGFEPLPNIFRDNLAFHKMNETDRQQVFNVGLSSESGKKILYVPNVYSIDSEITSASFEEDFFYNKKFSASEVAIRISTLDHFFQKEYSILKGKRVALKIDVEGHERKVLGGGQRFLRKLRPIIVMEIEQKRTNIESIYALLNELKYSLYALDTFGCYRLTVDNCIAFRGGRDFLLIPLEKASENYFCNEGLLQYLKGC